MDFSALAVVAFTLRLDASFLRGLVESVFRLNIHASCLGACRFSVTMGVYGSYGAGLARAFTISKAAFLVYIFVIWEKINYVVSAFSKCVCDVHCVTFIVFHSRPNVPLFQSIRDPKFVLYRFFFEL